MELGENGEDKSAGDMQRCPYLHEMKERLLGEQPPTEAVATPNQQTVTMVVKCNPDGFGSHTSPTHRTPLMAKEPEDEFEYTVHRKVYPKNAKKSDKDMELRHVRPKPDEKTSLFIIMSFVYAKLLVVVCIAYVVSDVVTHSIPLYYYEGFFTYLYGLSILFLLYIFCFLLQESTCCAGGAGNDAVAAKGAVVPPPPPPPPLPPPPSSVVPEPDKKKKKKEEEKKKKKEEQKRKKEEKKSKKQEKKDEAEQPISLQWQFEPDQPPVAPPSAPAPLLLRPPSAPPSRPNSASRDLEAQKIRHKRKTSQNDQSHGSFFLRIGAIAFGLGTMVYTGLELGTFFEIPFDSPCHMILRGINPVLQMIFTFMQMYFIFMNSRLNIHRFKLIARFGLMHVVATNLCVWIRTFVLEYLKDVTGYRPLEATQATSTIGSTSQNVAISSIPATMTTSTPWRRMHTVTTPSTATAQGFVTHAPTLPGSFFRFGGFNSLVANNLAEVQNEIDLTNATELIDNIVPQAMTGVNSTGYDICGRVNIMGNIVQDAGPYLYPFIVEYSLIGAAVIYVMWKHIGRNPRYVTQEDLEHRLDFILSRRAVAIAHAQQQGRVDCVGASKGLFLGLLLLVASMICLILFFVLVRHPHLGPVAIYLAETSHCALMALSVCAIAIGFIRVRSLKFKSEERNSLNDILLRVSAFGLFLYSAFGVIAGHRDAFTTVPNLLVMITSALAILQVVLQLLFISDVSRRRVHLAEHDSSKPGRQVVTLLLICNVAMWVIYTFETRKTEADPVQLEFYGQMAWRAVQRLALPMCIFHRFHSAVTLAEIWRTSYEARLE